MSWIETVESKRQQVQSRVPESWRKVIDAGLSSNSSNIFETTLSELLSPEEIKITLKPATQLVEEIASGKLTSESSVTAFAKRAALVARITNAVSEPLYHEAIARAKELDSQRAGIIEREGKLPPLYGLPVTVKDSFNIPGFQTTLGVVSRISMPVADKPSSIVDILQRQLGAVIFAKTNVPQAIITPEAHNNIFGRTLSLSNPEEWSAGGSSGGEGILVSANASPLGLGTDLGGSIRSPAWHNGCLGYKPSLKIVPYLDFEDAGKPPREPGVTAAVGPLARNIRDAELFIKAVVGTKPWESNKGLEEVVWGKKSEENQLTIGIATDTDDPPISSEVRNAIERVVKSLEDKGHKIVFLDGHFPSVKYISEEIAGPLSGLDFDLTHLKAIAKSGEPLTQSVANEHAKYFKSNKKSIPSKFTETSVAGEVAGKEETRHFINELFPYTLTDAEFDRLKKQQQDAKDQWNSVFINNSLDIVICPLQDTYAPEHDRINHAPFSATWNLLDWPALVLPLNRAKLGYNNKIKPEAVQLVAPNMHDEQLINAAKKISDDLGL